ncbi:MAG: hypothetical protein AAGD25_22195 [Cyanobacteria bacterium P01_F01_bin.150]
MPPEILKLCVVLLRSLLSGSPKERRYVFLMALGTNASVLNRIEWTGAADPFITHAVETLFEFGTLENGNNALLVFLEHASRQFGTDKQKRFEDLQKYIKTLQIAEDATYSSETVSHYPRFGRRQDLFVLTVKIRHPVQDVVVGTGILVKGKIITCGQVLRNAGVNPATIGQQVKVCLSPRNTGGQGVRTAEITAYYDHYKDEIVVLQLTNGYFGGVYAYTSGADLSTGNAFQSYGYTGEKRNPSQWVKGSICGHISPPEGIDSRVYAVELRTSDDLYPYMCGAGVLDLEHNAVVGILTTPSDNAKPGAIDACILELDHLQDVLSQED